MKFITFTLGASLLLLTACEQEAEVATEAPIKAVKVLEITEASQSKTRRIAGVIQSSNQSELSFRVGGQIGAVEVKEGDRVNKGKVLAVLDRKDYELALQSAQANLSSARANLRERNENLKRINALAEKKFASDAEVDQARSAYQTARSNTQIAEIALSTAEINLNNTVLEAPFDGVIAESRIDPFIEIAPGQTAFVLQGEEAFEAEVLMPESLIQVVGHGDIVQVELPSLENSTIAGTVLEIGAKTTTGNAFTVKIALSENLKGIRSGMTAQIVFNLQEAEADETVFLVPLAAIDVRIAVEDTGVLREARVFTFNPDQGVAEERLVKVKTIRGNQLEITSGLTAGDLLIVAGVPFLTNGQKVKRWQPTYNVPAKL